MKRCSWCNEKNSAYIKYHDEEWGIPCFDDEYLFEMLILEGFQAGLSWECVLNKRENFRAAFDGFDVQTIACYGEEKLAELANDAGIIRNKRKISASVKNANAFIKIVEEYGSFLEYLKQFWDGNIIYENDVTTSPLSDAISKDLKKKGMSFVGSTIIYSFLQAIGIINSHEEGCDLYK